MRVTDERPRLTEHRNEQESRAAVIFALGFHQVAAARWRNIAELIEHAQVLKHQNMFSLG
jgi:hypothetical protein